MYYYRIDETRGGFFDSKDHGEIGSLNCTIPEGAKEITDKQYAELIAAQGNGKLIVPDADGYPVLQAPEVPDRDVLEAIAWNSIKAERDRRTQLGGCLVGTSWFHTDTFSRSQWLGLKDQARDILAAGGAMTDPVKKLGSKVLWKTMGGTFVTVTVQLAFDVVGATGDSDARVFMQAEIHRAAMVASADPLAYDFSGGWPVNFEG